MLSPYINPWALILTGQYREGQIMPAQEVAVIRGEEIWASGILIIYNGQ